MADLKISGLTALTSPDDADVLAIADISASETKKITISNFYKVDTIAERTSAAGVTIDGVKLKDSEPYCDVINEKTNATGVTVDGVLLKDDGITVAADIVMVDNSVTGVDTITFTDEEGTIAGIQNQNLVDKAATETIAGAWAFSNISSFVNKADTYLRPNFYAYYAGNDPNILTFNAGRGTESSPAVSANSDAVMDLRARGYSVEAGSFIDAAHIKVKIDGEPDTASDATDMPGRIEFHTTPDGSGTSTERMRINNTGGVFMYNLKSGTDQSDAGAAANELYVDTNDDNTIKLGTA